MADQSYTTVKVEPVCNLNAPLPYLTEMEAIRTPASVLNKPFFNMCGPCSRPIEYFDVTGRDIQSYEPCPQCRQPASEHPSLLNRCDRTHSDLVNEKLPGQLSMLKWWCIYCDIGLGWHKADSFYFNGYCLCKPAFPVKVGRRKVD